MHVGIGNGTFASATKFTVGGEEAGTFDVSDLKGDGLPDLVATAFVSIPPGSTLSVLLHRPGLPLAPAIGGGSGGDHTATISWTAPPSNNTYPITGYIVTAVAFEPPSETITFNSTATTQTITGSKPSTKSDPANARPQRHPFSLGSYQPARPQPASGCDPYLPCWDGHISGGRGLCST